MERNHQFHPNKEAKKVVVKKTMWWRYVVVLDVQMRVKWTEIELVEVMLEVVIMVMVAVTVVVAMVVMIVVVVVL